jgi:hypothetical protein
VALGKERQGTVGYKNFEDWLLLHGPTSRFIEQHVRAELEPVRREKWHGVVPVPVFKGGRLLARVEVIKGTPLLRVCALVVEALGAAGVSFGWHPDGSGERAYFIES